MAFASSMIHSALTGTHMLLIQLFIPVADQHDKAFAKQPFADLKQELAGLFGGVTIYSRAPVEGIWKPDRQSTQTDRLIIYEVLASGLDLIYWQQLKTRLEDEFHQEQILIRYSEIAVIE